MDIAVIVFVVAESFFLREVQNVTEYFFQKLDRTLENGRTSEFAKKDENILKNRFENVVPFDRNRVILGPMVGHADASYINASVVKVCDQFFSNLS